MTRTVDQTFLKIFAMACMICDHAAVTLLAPESAPYMALRLIGKLAAPIFFYLLAVGFQKTSDRVRYLIRLAIIAIVSEVPFDLMVGGTALYMGRQNIFVSLFIAGCAITAGEALGKRAAAMVSRKAEETGRFPGSDVTRAMYAAEWAVYAAAAVLAWAVKADFYWYGVGLCVIFSMAVRFNNKKWNIAAAVLMAIQGWPYLFAVVSLPAVIMDNGERGRLGRARWFYLVYPLHILILVGIRWRTGL